MPEMSAFLLIIFVGGFAAGCLVSWLLPVLWGWAKPALRLLVS